jgi:hypothetical protein
VFGTAAITPVGLSGQLELIRELVDSASPGGDAIALSVMREDWYRQAEIKIYDALNTAQSGTITGGFVPTLRRRPGRTARSAGGRCEMP